MFFDYDLHMPINIEWNINIRTHTHLIYMYICKSPNPKCHFYYVLYNIFRRDFSSIYCNLIIACYNKLICQYDLIDLSPYAWDFVALHFSRALLILVSFSKLNILFISIHSELFLNLFQWLKRSSVKTKIKRYMYLFNLGYNNTTHS